MTQIQKRLFIVLMISDPIYKRPWRDAEMLSGRLEFVTERLQKAELLNYVRFHPGDSSTQITNLQQTLKQAGGVDLALLRRIGLANPIPRNKLKISRLAFKPWFRLVDQKESRRYLVRI